MFGHVETIVLVKVYNPPNPARHTAHSFNTLDFFGQKFPNAFSRASFKRKQLDVFTTTSFTVVFNVPINPKPDLYDISGILRGNSSITITTTTTILGKDFQPVLALVVKKKMPSN